MDDLVFLSAQMPKSLKDDLAYEAWKRRLTVSELIRLLIKKFLIDGETQPAAQTEHKKEE